MKKHSRKFAPLPKTKHFKKGAIIETRGESEDHIHLIDEGLVQIGISGIENADTVIIRQVDLAHSLGLSRVSIGKALKEVSRKGLIKIGYGKLEILSREKLTDLIRKGQRQI